MDYFIRRWRYRTCSGYIGGLPYVFVSWNRHLTIILWIIRLPWKSAKVSLKSNLFRKSIVPWHKVHWLTPEAIVFWVLTSRLKRNNIFPKKSVFVRLNMTTWRSWRSSSSRPILRYFHSDWESLDIKIVWPKRWKTSWYLIIRAGWEWPSNFHLSWSKSPSFWMHKERMVHELHH